MTERETLDGLIIPSDVRDFILAVADKFNTTESIVISVLIAFISGQIQSLKEKQKPKVMALIHSGIRSAEESLTRLLEEEREANANRD